jgi:hypothetical protein
VSVSVTVVALTGTRPFPLVAVQVVGLGPGLAAEVIPSTVEVTLAGTVATLNAFGSEAVGASIDLSGRGPGTYTADVAIRAPSGTGVQSVQPPRVTVTIRSLRTPTPAPSGTP